MNPGMRWLSWPWKYSFEFCTSYRYAANSETSAAIVNARLHRGVLVVVGGGRREEHHHEQRREQHRLAAHDHQRARDHAGDHRVRRATCCVRARTTK